MSTANDEAAMRDAAPRGTDSGLPDTEHAPDEEEQDAPREFYSRFFLRLDVILIALLALLWALNKWFN